MYTMYFDMIETVSLDRWSCSIPAEERRLGFSDGFLLSSSCMSPPDRRLEPSDRFLRSASPFRESRRSPPRLSVLLLRRRSIGTALYVLDSQSAPCLACLPTNASPRVVYCTAEGEHVTYVGAEGEWVPPSAPIKMNVCLWFEVQQDTGKEGRSRS
jgi:hypothetical protein